MCEKGEGVVVTGEMRDRTNREKKETQGEVNGQMVGGSLEERKRKERKKDS